MTDDTMLAYLSNRLGRGAENLATEALNYLLRNPDAAAAMNAHVRRFAPALPEMASFATQAHSPNDTGIPDLVGKTDAGEERLVLEAKFGAALDAGQVTTYLGRLLALGGEGLLLFLVPLRRVQPIWAEVRRVCHQNELPLDIISDNPPTASVCREAPDGRGECGATRVAVASWADLLNALQSGLSPRDHPRTSAELDQLRGLCDREDRTAFIPFTSELLGGTVGRHLMDLDSLLNEAVETLTKDGLASTKGLRWQGTQRWAGRYFLLAGLPALLHVHYRRWGTEAATPLWLRVWPGDSLEVPGLLGPLRKEDRLFDADGKLLIPIYLSTGVDRDAVFREISEQLREVHTLLSSAGQIALDDGAPNPDPLNDPMQDV